jgi:hypothetical protein
MASDFNPAPVIAKHWTSIKGSRVWNIVIPVAAGLFAWIADAAISAPTGAAAMTVCGLLAAFYLQLAVQTWEQASAWADTVPTPGKKTTERGESFVYLSANAVYGMLTAFLAATVALGSSIVASGRPERISAALLVALMTHLGFILLLLGVRTYHTTSEHLNDAVGGARFDRSRNKAA